jgi:hypothetical protein
MSTTLVQGMPFRPRTGKIENISYILDNRWSGHHLAANDGEEDSRDNFRLPREFPSDEMLALKKQAALSTKKRAVNSLERILFRSEEEAARLFLEQIRQYGVPGIEKIALSTINPLFSKNPPTKEALNPSSTYVLKGIYPALALPFAQPSFYFSIQYAHSSISSKQRTHYRKGDFDKYRIEARVRRGKMFRGTLYTRHRTKPVYSLFTSASSYVAPLPKTEYVLAKKAVPSLNRQERGTNIITKGTYRIIADSHHYAPNLSRSVLNLYPEFKHKSAYSAPLPRTQEQEKNHFYKPSLERQTPSAGVPTLQRSTHQSYAAGKAPQKPHDLSTLATLPNLKPFTYRLLENIVESILQTSLQLGRKEPLQYGAENAGDAYHDTDGRKIGSVVAKEKITQEIIRAAGGNRYKDIVKYLLTKQQYDFEQQMAQYCPHPVDSSRMHERIISYMFINRKNPTEKFLEILLNDNPLPFSFGESNPLDSIVPIGAEVSILEKGPNIGHVNRWDAPFNRSSNAEHGGFEQYRIALSGQDSQKTIRELVESAAQTYGIPRELAFPLYRKGLILLTKPSHPTENGGKLIAPSMAASKAIGGIYSIGINRAAINQEYSLRKAA